MPWPASTRPVDVDALDEPDNRGTSHRQSGHVDRPQIKPRMRCGTKFANGIPADVIPTRDLRAIGRARLRDAQVLLGAKRYDGAAYLCGYAVELTLKARMCRTLKWSGFPATANEFKGLQSMKTHDLNLLLRLSGIESRVEAMHLTEWSAVMDWSPEWRYRTRGESSPQQTRFMVWCVTKLLEVL
jgi:HEPN domain